MKQFILDHIDFFIILDNFIIGLTCFTIGLIYATLVFSYYFNYARYDKNIFDTITYTKEDPKRLTLPIPTGKFVETLYIFMSVLFYHSFSRRLKFDKQKTLKYKHGRRMFVSTIVVTVLLISYALSRMLDIIPFPSTEEVTRMELMKMGIDDPCIDELVKRNIIILE